MDHKESWIFSRVTLRVLAALGFGAIGWWVGHAWHLPVLSGLVLAGASILVISIADTLKGHEFLDWLRTPDLTPPDLPGLWGEAAHRVHRVLRARDLQIQHEAERLNQLLSGIEASPNGVILLDVNDQITWISRSAAQHFGLNTSRDIQQRITNLIRTPAFVSYLNQGEYGRSVMLPSGQINGILSVAIHRYGDGLKIVLSQDVTERAHADAMRRDFVANVSHEIRTPLTVLHGFLETMSNLKLTEVERERVLQLMMQQAERMQTLVADLLVLAQIEGSPQPSTDVWVGVTAMMDRLKALAEGLSKGQHSIRFELNAAQPAYELAGSESEWFSAMSNLISNAIRYTPAGGDVTVKWHVKPEGAAEFSVKDSGIGIDAQHIPRLTERFYRVDGSRSRETGGTGLGLSIVKHVIQRHGGELRVDSDKGKGSTFTLQIQAARVRAVNGAVGKQTKLVSAS